MTAPSPAVRAAFVVATLVVIVGVVATAFHLGRIGTEVERSTARGVEARAATLAAALATGDGDLRDRFERLAALDWPVGLALLDGDGGVVSSSDAALSGASPWPRLLEARGSLVASKDGTRFAAAASPIGESGLSLGVAQVIGQPGGTWAALGLALGLIVLVLGAVAAMAWYAGPRATAVLNVTAERMAANRDGDPRTQVEAAERVLGVQASPLRPLAKRLLATRSDLSDASRQVAALLQINPHYVLIATFDGELIEANPAFYAATGLDPAIVRGSRIETLREVFPLDPLLELADRSDREGSSIQGIEYGLVDADGRSLPVLVSLRAVRVRQRKAVLIQATDVAKEKRLERQVAAFSDTLELMVDQRVANLTAGKTRLRNLLDRAGIVLASFDGSGGTVRWNGAAETFSGRMQTDASHFHTAVSALGLADVDRAAFASWFWGDVRTPFVADSTFAQDDGSQKTHRMVWRTAPNTMPGSADRRTLIGVEVPESLPVGAFVPDASIPVPEAPADSAPRETGLPTYESVQAPTAEAVAEEEAWIRRLASEGPDAFGGAGALRRDRRTPPGGGSWISRNTMSRTDLSGDGR
ncbi:MAG: PAS domain-containing protein [Bacteroidota bacterium]